MRRIARVAAVVAALTLGACATTGPTITEVVSVPPGALLRIEGFGECETPCRIEIDRPRQIEVVKTGYKTEIITIAPGQARAEVILELSAPTVDVKSETLPDL